MIYYIVWNSLLFLLLSNFLKKTFFEAEKISGKIIKKLCHPIGCLRSFRIVTLQCNKQLFWKKDFVKNWIYLPLFPILVLNQSQINAVLIIKFFMKSTGMLLYKLFQLFVGPPCASSTSSHVTLMMVKSCFLVFFLLQGRDIVLWSRYGWQAWDAL